MSPSIFTHIQPCFYIYIYTYLLVYTHIRTHTYICTHICIYVCVYIHMCICIYLCMFTYKPSSNTIMSHTQEQKATYMTRNAWSRP